MTAKVTVEFEDSATAEHFMSWMDGQGEQDYWMWMDGADVGGKHTAKYFAYDFKKREIVGTRERDGSRYIG